MRRSGRPWLIGSACGILAMALTWYLSHEVAALRLLDVSILQGFLELRRPILDGPANLLTSLFNPFPYVVLCAVPVGVALRRGRRDVALGILVLLFGANATTELLKPLAVGPRDWVAVPGIYLSHATWPSGHSTASMSLALALVISAPQRLRPLVASLMAALVIGVGYSLLTLGWHFPSDVLGGFEMAICWALFVVGAVRAHEARRPALASQVTRPRALSLTETLRPAAVMIVCALGVAAALTAARPAQVLGFATAHPAFMTGAVVIALLSFACASGFSLLLRRSAAPGPGSARAPTAAPRSRPPRSRLG